MSKKSSTAVDPLFGKDKKFRRRVEGRFRPLLGALSGAKFRAKATELCARCNIELPYEEAVRMFKMMIVQRVYDYDVDTVVSEVADRRSLLYIVGIIDLATLPTAEALRGFRMRLGGEGVNEFYDFFEALMQERRLLYKALFIIC